MDRMLTDVTVISHRLGPLAEAGKNIAKLQTLVKDKSIPRKNVSQAMAGLLKRSSSKKEVEQEETVETAEGKDDGDEDGESLGILTKEQATDQEAQTADDAEREAALATPAVEAISTPIETSEPTTEVSVPTADSAREPTEPTETSPSDVPAPTTPAKDNEPETEKLEPAGEDDPTVTETLAASPVQEKELPVDPVSPMDAENAPPAKEENATEDAPPALPVKDANADSTNDAGEKEGKDEGEAPDVPTKTD